MTEPTRKCNSCNKEVNLDSDNKGGTECEFCTKKYMKDNNIDSDEEADEVPEQRKSPIYCKECSDTCYVCKNTGCAKCVDCVCCDCCVSMCPDCAYSGEPDCGCYGTCAGCGTDVNRGEHGWPCSCCNKWLCDSCRYNNNNCEECNPN